MHLHLILAVVILAFLGWFIFEFVSDYKKATGTVWPRLLAAAQQSATLLWSKFVIVVSAATAGLSQLADYLHEPELADKIQAILAPKYVPFYMIAIALVTIWARRRTLAPKA